MKLPNSYGSVIKLGGKRRKPYAVRISKLVEDDTGKVKRKYTYLAYTYGTYMNGNFNTCMGKLKMKHLPHDGRHTFASLMDSAGANDVCIKLIMGHSMKNDTTKGTYTHAYILSIHHPPSLFPKHNCLFGRK